MFKVGDEVFPSVSLTWFGDMASRTCLRRFPLEIGVAIPTTNMTMCARILAVATYFPNTAPVASASRSTVRFRSSKFSHRVGIVIQKGNRFRSGREINRENLSLYSWMISLINPNSYCVEVFSGVLVLKTRQGRTISDNNFESLHVPSSMHFQLNSF